MADGATLAITLGALDDDPRVGPGIPSSWNRSAIGLPCSRPSRCVCRRLPGRDHDRKHRPRCARRVHVRGTPLAAAGSRGQARGDRFGRGAGVHGDHAPAWSDPASWRPRASAISRTTDTALRVATLLRVFYLATRPLVDLLTGLGNLVLLRSGYGLRGRSGTRRTPRASCSSCWRRAVAWAHRGRGAGAGRARFRVCPPPSG